MRLSVRMICLLACSTYLSSCATGTLEENESVSSEIEEFSASEFEEGSESSSTAESSSEAPAEESFSEEPAESTASSAAADDSNQVEDELKLDEDKQTEMPEDLAFEELPEDNQDQTALAQEPPPPAVEELAPVAQQEPPPPALEEPAAETAAAVQITDLQFLAHQKGGSVVIETTGPAQYTTRRNESENQFIVEIENATLPAKLKRPFITKDFKGAIASINAYQDPGSSTARVVIQLRDATELDIQQDGTRLVVAKPEGEAPVQVAQEPAEDDISESGSSTFDEFVTGQTKFYGRKINIEVTDEDIRNVFNLIAEESGANLVLDDKVSGTITVKLREVPWDQALVVVMKAKGLGYVRQGNVLRVAPLDDLRKEADTAREIVESRQKLDPLKVKVLPVSYASVDDLVKQSEKFLSPRGKAAADNRTSSIVITDTAETIERLARLIKTLDVAPDQVLIEGKIVEAKDTFSRDIGVKWGIGGNNTQITTSPSGLPVSLMPSAGFGGGVTQTALGLNLNVNVGTLDVLGDLTSSLALYEREELVKVVSSPRVVTMNREKSFITQSDQEPVQELTQNGSGPPTTSVRYEPAELRLEVMPQITPDGGVIMEIDVKREFFGAAGSGGAKPKFARQAKTRVLVRTGQTAVIGGIYDNNQTESEDGVPGLRKIPLLGWLFKYKNRTNAKNELIIFLTPRILGRVEGSQGSVQ